MDAVQNLSRPQADQRLVVLTQLVQRYRRMEKNGKSRERNEEHLTGDLGTSSANILHASVSANFSKRKAEHEKEVFDLTESDHSAKRWKEHS